MLLAEWTRIEECRQVMEALSHGAFWQGVLVKLYWAGRHQWRAWRGMQAGHGGSLKESFGSECSIGWPSSMKSFKLNMAYVRACMQLVHFGGLMDGCRTSQEGKKMSLATRSALSQGPTGHWRKEGRKGSLFQLHSPSLNSAHMFIANEYFWHIILLKQKLLP